MDGVRCVPEFVFSADMATHWGWYGAGGVHDEKFCHRCNCLRDNRACMYNWYTLPPAPCGDRWTVAEDARQVCLNEDDFIYLNTQRGAREENMLEHHITFRMPSVAKQTRARLGTRREDVATAREGQTDEIESAMQAARGQPMDALAFRTCIRLRGFPPTDVVPPGSPSHDCTLFC